MNPDKKFADFKEILKEYYSDEGNKKILSKMTTKDRLGMCELSLIGCAKRIKNLEDRMRYHIIIIFILSLAVIALTFMKG